jgi:RNA polymerase-binding transcription factor DksA
MEREEAIRRKLEVRLAELERRTEQIGRDLRQPANPDWDDRASERENDEVLEGLERAELSDIGAIRKALLRMAAGRYATCEGCDGPIGPRRLEALPTTSRCIGCAD